MSTIECADPIYIGSEHSVTVTGLKNADTDTFVNDATVNAQVYESDRATTVGASSSIAYEADSPGNYSGNVLTAVTDLLTENTRYYIQVAITGTITDKRWLPVTARYRGET